MPEREGDDCSLDIELLECPKRTQEADMKLDYLRDGKFHFEFLDFGLKVPPVPPLPQLVHDVKIGCEDSKPVNHFEPATGTVAITVLLLPKPPLFPFVNNVPADKAGSA